MGFLRRSHTHTQTTFIYFSFPKPKIPSTSFFEAKKKKAIKNFVGRRKTSIPISPREQEFRICKIITRISLSLSLSLMQPKKKEIEELRTESQEPTDVVKKR